MKTGNQIWMFLCTVQPFTSRKLGSNIEKFKVLLMSPFKCKAGIFQVSPEAFPESKLGKLKVLGNCSCVNLLCVVSYIIPPYIFFGTIKSMADKLLAAPVHSVQQMY